MGQSGLRSAFFWLPVRFFVGFPFRSNCRLRLAKSHLAYATAPLLVERTASCRTGPWGHSTRSVRHEARDRASRGSESQPLRACHSRGDRRPSRNTSEPEESNQGRRPGSAARGGGSSLKSRQVISCRGFGPREHRAMSLKAP